VYGPHFRNNPSTRDPTNVEVNDTHPTTAEFSSDAIVESVCPFMRNPRANSYANPMKVERQRDSDG